MKTQIKKLCAVAALLTNFCLLLATLASGQTFTVLHGFTTNASGYAASPGGLTFSGNVLYGVSAYGDSGVGTVFSVNTDGTGFTTIYQFTAPTGTNRLGEVTNTDGAYPSAPMTLSGATLYGTTFSGGTSGGGTVFSINTNGTGFTNLHSFESGNHSGGDPRAGVVLSGNTLYGTSFELGIGYGTVFAVGTDGTGFTNLHVFEGSDGGEPYGNLVLSGATLYGTTSYGGSTVGTVFAINTDGTGFTNLHTFNYATEGGSLKAGLVLSGDTLYGTASAGGNGNSGTVFAINTDGTGFTLLHAFAALPYPFEPNSDGAQPLAALSLAGNSLYGTTFLGGSNGYGTVFGVNTNGTGFATFYSFGGGSHFNESVDNVIVSNNTLYGTSAGPEYGMVFGISLPVQLTIGASGPNVVLTWPMNAAGFTLQSTPNLTSPVAWTPVSPAPAVVNGLNTVTNAMSGDQQFYRLSQ